MPYPIEQLKKIHFNLHTSFIRRFPAFLFRRWQSLISNCFVSIVVCPKGNPIAASTRTFASSNRLPAQTNYRRIDRTHAKPIPGAFYAKLDKILFYCVQSNQCVVYSDRKLPFSSIFKTCHVISPVRTSSSVKAFYSQKHRSLSRRDWAWPAWLL